MSGWSISTTTASWYSRRRRSYPAFRGAAAAFGARRAARCGIRMAARHRNHEDRQPHARPGRRGADHRLRPSAQRRRRHLSGHRPPQLYRSPEKSGPRRRHRACRFPGAGARGGRSRRAGARPGDAGRIPEAARHRDPRSDADGENHPRGFRRYFRRAEAADRLRPRRHGLDVQGAGGHRAPSGLGRGPLRRRGRPGERHDVGIVAACGHSRPAPRVLHLRGWRIRRHLPRPQWRPGSNDDRPTSRKTAAGWPSRWASRPSGCSALIRPIRPTSWWRMGRGMAMRRTPTPSSPAPKALPSVSPPPIADRSCLPTPARA